MNSRESLLYWALPFGTWFGTRVRISVFFPLLVLVLCWKFGLALGGVVSGIVFLSVLFHEFGHIVAAHRTGGTGDEILVWPLGGLSYVQPAGTFRSRFSTAAAGPAVNLVLCLITLWHVLQLEPDVRAAVFHPLKMPIGELSRDLASAVSDVLLLTFTVNWVLLLVNLIPVYPLDGGRMLQAVLTSRLGGSAGTEAYIKIGFFFAFVMMFGGLIADSTFVVFIGSIVLVLNMQESFHMRTGDAYDESFMGYDFSQGYTSLERSVDDPPARRPGFFRRRKEKRRMEKQRRMQEKEAEAARQLDALLDKVHTQGIDSLSEAEKRQLDRASARYRNKGDRHE